MATILDVKEFQAQGAQDAEPLMECTICKTWFPASAADVHTKRCKRRLMIKNAAEMRKGG